MDIYLWFGLWFGINGKKKLSTETLGRYLIWAEDQKNDPYKAYRKGIPYYSRNHGFNPFDAEHATVDLLFDYYTVSGSFWARDELKMMGEWINGVMRFKEYNTAWPQAGRAEGWTMQAWVQCYLATGDERLKGYALRRIKEIMVPKRYKGHPSRGVYSQWDNSGQWPKRTLFHTPWQHAALIYGYLGAMRFFGSEDAMKIIEDSIYCADYCTVRNFTDPVTKQFHERSIRYAVPLMIDGWYNNKLYKMQPVPMDIFDTDPKIKAYLGGGTEIFFLSASYLAAKYTKDPDIRRKALDLGDWLLGDYQNYYDRWRLWMKWGTVIPEELLPENRK